MADLGFGKKLRLLGAADFQPVFKNARYKISCQHLLLLAVDSQSSYPRLGLVIAKKNVAKATARNRVKRLIRESFRHNQRLLPKLDIVILARSGLGALENDVVHTKIERLWQDLIHKSSRSPVTPRQPQRDHRNAG